MKHLSLLLLLGATILPLSAQRQADSLDRGLIAMKSGNSIYVSWRLLGEEYYDVTYNIYRDGEKLNETPLSVTNFSDSQGSTSSTYTVSAVVRGVEQPQCPAATVWSSSYTEIALSHEGIASTLVPNDACCADVDGDGQLEILMKFDNWSEIEQSYPKYGPTINGVATKEYSIFETLKLDGTRLWWVNCGPNMGDFQNNEQNIVAYDWDGDGKAEAVFRAADGTTIHTASGEVVTIGDPNKNFRGATGGGTNWFMHAGAEYLVYVNGETGEPYQIIDYPLKRLEESENPNHLESGSEYDNLVNNAWGDGYGHRSSKYFFGAPYLDGRKPSIFLARGIYTQIKMRAYDVNPETHELVLRWDWRQTAGGYWMWQGFHNFGIADVDEDGRDEICYGSMVVDDCGKGLSTTGLGHGDAQHCSDFNPYTKGLEIYTCNEDQPGNNYRDATTSKIYHRFNAGNDDGRAMMGNFSDAFPGSIGCSAREGAISSVTYSGVDGMEATGINTNFRIYWDGDLCSETFNYLNGKNTEGCVAKYGSWSPIYTMAGSMTNNDTKGTPCYQGDILGDWREEVIMRTANNNIRIYSTPSPTTYRIPTLWSDHQYRNAMVWQMCGYNQPPHLSFFLGKLEGMTQAPPPLTMNGRVEVKHMGTINSSFNDKHVIVCETGNSVISMDEGATPYIATFNVPSWVKGTAGSNYTAKDANISYNYYTCDVLSGSLAGEARLVKQGDGILKLPKSDFTHTGETRIWGGTLNFDGTMKQSDLWLNRFTTLISDGGIFHNITALYAAQIQPGGEGKIGTLTADSLCLDFGSRLVIDMNGTQHDQLKLGKLTTIRKSGIWATAGPEYIQPVLEIRGTNLEAGDYVIAECEKLYGSATNLKIEGVEGFKTGLKFQDGKLILTLGSTRGATSVIWTGKYSSTWDFANSTNFALPGSDGSSEVFVNGDYVIFNDEASSFDVNLTDNVTVDTLLFANNTKSYTLSGDGSIVGGALVKEGNGKVTINTLNTYKGGNYLRGGTLVVGALSNDITESGNTGGVTTGNNKFVISNGATLQTTAAVTNGSPVRLSGDEGGIIDAAGDFTQQKAFYGTVLTKKGNGTLITSAGGENLTRLVIAGGTVRNGSGNAAQTIEFMGGSLVDNVGTSNTLYVAENRSGTWTTGNRCTYTNKITGAGTLTIYCATEKGSTWYATRTPLKLNLSAFEGTLIPKAVYSADGRFTLSTANGSSQFTLNIPQGITVQNEGKTLTMGKVIGKGSLGGSCTFSNGASVGVNTWRAGNDEDFTFPGLVIDNAKFEKTGSGAMTVTGAWTNTGTVTISSGSLIASGTTSAPVSLGTGVLTINAGATLYGNNFTLSNSSINVKGEIAMGLANALNGTMNFGGKNVTIPQNGTISFVIRKKSTGATVLSGTTFTNMGVLNLNGILKLNFYTSDGENPFYTPAAGDEIRLWKDGCISKCNVGSSFKVETNMLQITFDTSRISEGVLVVSEVTGLQQIGSDFDDNDAIYTLSGVRVDEPTAPGIYLRNGKKFIVK